MVRLGIRRFCVLLGGALSSLYIAAAPGDETAISGITRVTRISWNSQFGKAYRVFWSADPAGSWEPLGDSVSGTGAEMHSYDDDQHSAKRFYRIEVHDITPAGMAPVTGGTYEMGDHFDFREWDALPVHTVHVASFYMTSTEVTNADFCAFLTAANWSGELQINGRTVESNSNPPVFYVGLRDSHSDTPDIFYDERLDIFGIIPGRDRHPVFVVGWHGAAAYCNWLSRREALDPCYDVTNWECDFEAEGYRLPTEAEWEYAARGGLRYGIYPWGDEIDGSKANYFASGDPHDDDWLMGLGAPTTPVGSYAPNAYGLYDIAGNVLELCNDWFDPDYYTFCVENGIHDNPEGPAHPPHDYARAQRGGSCLSDPTGLSCSARYWQGNVGISGFRYVRRPTTR